MGGQVDKMWNCFGWRIKRSTVKRYFALVNICLLGLGAFVCFDSVGSLQEALMDKLKISFAQFSLLYSVNSWPNILLSPIGGYLIDRVFGIRKGALFYAFVYLVGHQAFALSVMFACYWCSLIGRLLAGIGHEFGYICLQLYSIYYFKGKELSLAFCVTTNVGRLGSSIAYAIAEPLLFLVKQVMPGKADVGIVVSMMGTFTLLIALAATVLLILTPKEKESKAKHDGEVIETKNEQQTKIKFQDFFIWPLEFWLIVIIQCSFINAVYVLLPFTQELFKTVNGYTVEESNSVTSFFSVIGAVTAPFIGVLIDKIGKDIFFSQLAFTGGLVAHAMIGFTTCSPYLSMFILSISYGVFNGSVIPMVAIIIPGERLGTACGVVLTFTNGTYSLLMYLAGLTVDEFQYVGLGVFMLCNVLMGVLASIWLLILDKKKNGILNIKSVERKKILENKKQLQMNEATQPLKC